MDAIVTLSQRDLNILLGALLEKLHSSSDTLLAIPMDDSSRASLVDYCEYTGKLFKRLQRKRKALS